MESTFFTDAAKFIGETMDAFAYAERAESHLVEMEKRWNKNTMNEVDLYFLKNLGVLLRCALQDFGCNDTNQRRKNSNSDRNCMEKEKKAVKLESLLPGIIQKSTCTSRHKVFYRQQYTSRPNLNKHGTKHRCLSEAWTRLSMK
jgi:hypothetical protein